VLDGSGAGVRVPIVARKFRLQSGWSQGGQEGESVKETPKQLNLSGLPQAKQGREVPPQWAWTEASVWTERMLATLERGITGGKWHSLIDKNDPLRYPNAYFAEHGLISLKALAWVKRANPA
jgi:hypothetical protein